MIPQTRLDEDTCDLDVKYGIADCRKRLRSQRATLRALHQTPADVTSCESELSGPGLKSYAEVLANLSMKQESISRLVESLLGLYRSPRRLRKKQLKRLR